LMQAFERRNKGRSYADSIKPYNFILSAHVMPNGTPTGMDPEHFHLVTDFSTDPRQWTKRRWTDIYSSERFAITTKGAVGGEGVARVQSYADVLARYRTHPEPKSRAVADASSGRLAVGLLERRPVTALSVVGIGKEANKLEAVEAKLVHSMDEVLQVFEHPTRDKWRDHFVPILKLISIAELTARTGLATSTIKAARNERSMPSKDHRDRLAAVAVAHARAELQNAGLAGLRNDHAVCGEYLAWRAKRALPARLCRTCGKPLPSSNPRSVYCSAACRKRASRAISD